MTQKLNVCIFNNIRGHRDSLPEENENRVVVGRNNNISGRIRIGDHSHSGSSQMYHGHSITITGAGDIHMVMDIIVMKCYA